jgi:hypothetical protein
MRQSYVAGRQRESNPPAGALHRPKNSCFDNRRGGTAEGMAAERGAEELAKTKT